MLNDIIALIISFVFVFAVIAITGLLKHIYKLSAETSRKFIHILLCNWIFVIYFFDNPFIASIAPVFFIAVNFISRKKKLIKAMERDSDTPDTYGTVFYAVTLLAAVWVAYYTHTFIAVCGVLAMGYGDGLAALVGERGGKKLPAPIANKTIGGSMVLLIAVVACIAAVLSRNLYQHDLSYAHIFYTSIFIGFAAMLVELFSPRGTDNLTLPLTVMLGVWVAVTNPAWLPHFSLLYWALFVPFVAWLFGKLTLPATAAATFLATAVYITSGSAVYFSLFAFFAVSVLFGQLGKTRKQAAEALHAKTGARGLAQVFANGAPSLGFGIAYFTTSNSVFLIAAIACFSAATADTLSSEIGILSKIPPMNIITFKPMQKGLSGGVSLLGFAGAIIGAAAIATVSLLYSTNYFWFVFAAGIFGSIIDSVLGALFQAKYKTDEGFTEKPPVMAESISSRNKQAKPAKGFALINNDVVNFISVAASGGLCLLFLLAF